MRLAVVTLAYGAAEHWHAVSGPNQRAYAERVGAEYVRLSGSSLLDKLQVGDVLGDYDRVCYLDADVMLRDDAVDLFAAVPPNMIGVRKEHAHAEYHAGKLAEVLKSQGVQGDARAVPIYNTGVYVASREHRACFERPAKPLPADHCAEQDWTRWLMHTRSQVAPLSPATVGIWSTDDRVKFRAASVQHFAGHPERLAALRGAFSKGPRAVVAIGAYRMSGAVELQLALIRKHCGDVPVIVHHDGPPDARLRGLPVELRHTPARLGHSGGDLGAFHHGLAYADAMRAEYCVKLSQRFLIDRRDWVGELIADMRGYSPTATHGCRYGTATVFHARTECVGMHVPTWVRHVESLAPRVIGVPTEEWFTGLARRLNSNWAGPRFFGPDRHTRYPGVVWKEADDRAAYLALFVREGVEPGEDFHTQAWQDLPGHMY